METVLKLLLGWATLAGAAALMWVDQAPEKFWWTQLVLFAAVVFDWIFGSARAVKEQKFKVYVATKSMVSKPAMYGFTLAFMTLVGIAIDKVILDSGWLFTYEVPTYVAIGLLVKELLSGFNNLNACLNGALETGKIKRLILLLEKSRQGLLNEDQMVHEAKNLARSGVKVEDLCVQSGGPNGRD